VGSTWNPEKGGYRVGQGSRKKKREGRAAHRVRFQLKRPNRDLGAEGGAKTNLKKKTENPSGTISTGGNYGMWLCSVELENWGPPAVDLEKQESQKP